MFVVGVDFILAVSSYVALCVCVCMYVCMCVFVSVCVSEGVGLCVQILRQDIGSAQELAKRAPLVQNKYEAGQALVRQT